MTDEIELNGGQNEITELPFSESENEQVVIKVESPPKGFDRVDLVGGTSVPQRRCGLFDCIFAYCYSLVLTEIQDTNRSREGTKLSKQKSKGTWSDQSLALLITVMVFFAGAAYMVLFSFHDAFPISAPFKGVNLSIWELLTFPRAATDDFLVITTVTTTFILSMGMNTIAVCIFFRKFIRGTFLTTLSLLTIAAFSLSFFAMLSKFVPHHITIAGGNLKIPATFIVIFYDIYMIILVCAFAYTIQWWQSSRRKQDTVVERKSAV